MTGRKSTEAKCLSHHAVTVLTNGGGLDRLVKVVSAHFLQPLSSFGLLFVGRRETGFMSTPGPGHICFYCLGFFCDESFSSSLSITFVRRELPTFH